MAGSRKCQISDFIKLPKFLILLSALGISACESFDQKVVSGNFEPLSDNLSIELKSDGTGEIVDEFYNISIGDSLKLFAIKRNDSGSYIENTDVSWTLTENMGTLTIQLDGKSANFSAVKAGQGHIKISTEKSSINVLVNISEFVSVDLPSFTMVDPNTASNLYSGKMNVNVAIISSNDIEKWCLSELQLTSPLNSDQTCVGGQGGSDGWNTAKPTSLLLSSGDNQKIVFLWAASSTGNVHSTMVSQTITLNTTIPLTPTIIVNDATTSDVNTTNSSLVNLTISGESDAVKWCLIEQISVAPSPAKPSFNDSCFVSTRPTTTNLSATGLRTVYIYTQNEVGNISLVNSDSINYIANSFPTAANDSLLVEINSFTNSNVVSNDIDLNGDTLSIQSVTQGANGIAAITSNSSISYTPNAAYSGTDAFTYTVQDGRGGTSTATVSIVIHSSQFTWMGANGDGKWSTAGNWCGAISAGVCQYDVSAPTSTDIAKFASSCIDCNVTIDIDPNVLGVNISSAFTGTITQAVGINFTIGTSGFYQAGGTFNGNASIMRSTGRLTLFAGTFNAPSGTLRLGHPSSASYLTILRTYMGATFNHSNGILLLNPLAGGCTGGPTYLIDLAQDLNVFDVKVDGGDPTSCQSNGTSVIGASLIIENDLHHIKNAIRGGNWRLYGNLFVSSGAAFGPGKIIFSGTANQEYDFIGSGSTAKVQINKPLGGTVIPSATTTSAKMNGFKLIAGNFTAPTGRLNVYFDDYWGGTEQNFFTVDPATTFNHNNGILRISATKGGCGGTSANPIYVNVDNTLSLNNLEILGSVGGSCNANKIVVSSGDTLLLDGYLNYLDGDALEGNIELKGDLFIQSLAGGGTATLTLNGLTNQNITQFAGGKLPNGELVLDNNAGFTLLSDLNLRGVGHNLNLNAGNVNMAGYDISGVDSLIIQLGLSFDFGGSVAYLSCDGPEVCP